MHNNGMNIFYLRNFGPTSFFVPSTVHSQSDNMQAGTQYNLTSNQRTNSSNSDWYTRDNQERKKCNESGKKISGLHITDKRRDKNKR